jgi:uncharacterized protein
MKSAFSIAGLTTAPGTASSGYMIVDETPGGSMFRVPLMIINGAQAGPTLLVTTGVHGDDLTTLPVIWELASRVKPDSLRGQWIGIPVANPPAFDAGSHLTPGDHKSLTFPGRRDGTVSERIAFILAQQLLSGGIDYLIDMHGGSVRSTLAVLAMIEETGGATQDSQEKIARAFGPDVLIRKGFKPDAPRSLTGEANVRGIPAVVVGMGVYGFYDEFTERGTHGIVNVMRALGMLAGTVENRNAPIEALIEVYQQSPASGVFFPRVRVGTMVEKGQVVGTIRNMFGGAIADVQAQTTGVIDALRHNPVIPAGDWVVSIAPLAERKGR